MVKSRVKKVASKPIAPKVVRKRTGRPTTHSAAEAKSDAKSNGAPHHHNGHQNGAAAPAAGGEAVVEPRLDAGSIKTKSGVDLTEKVRELLMLAKEQGHLTYDDINDALPESIVTPEDLDQIYTKLANLEVEIVDQAEVDRVKAPEAE